MGNPEKPNEKPIVANEAIPKTEFVDEKTIRYRMNSSEGIELLPSSENDLGNYLKNKKLTPEELENEIVKFDKLVKVSKFFEIPISEEEIKDLLEKGDISEGIAGHFKKNVDKMPFERLASFLDRLPNELDDVIPTLGGHINRASEIDAYTENEYMQDLSQVLQGLKEKLDENPKTIAQLVELQDDFRLLSHKAQPIIDEFKGGPFRNLAFKLEEILQPISQQISSELEEFKDKAARSKISYNDRCVDAKGKFLNSKEFYEANI